MNEEKEFNKIVINWYPGHMAKTKRLISEAKEMILEYQSQIKGHNGKKIFLILNFTDC